MVQQVHIRKFKKVIKVHFMYNTDLVDIMRDNGGWWFKKEKCWQFPVGRFSEIYNELKNNRYNVKVTLIED